MGRHQRAETSGLLICAVVGAVSMNLYMEYAPAIWQLTQRRFMVCSGIVAACGVISFIIGYARKSRSLNLKHGWFAPIRRIFSKSSPFGGVCLDHFPVVFCTHRCGQRHDGQCHLLRLYPQRLPPSPAWWGT